MTEIKLPLRHEDKLVEDETRELLNATLVPYDQAKSGDFIALTQSVYIPITDRSPSGGRHQVLWRKTEAGAEWVKYKTLVEEGHPRLAELAHLALTVLDDAIYTGSSDMAVRAINNSDDTFWADVILFPADVMVVARDDLEYEIEDAECDSLDEIKEISNIIQVVTPTLGSAHEKVAATPAIEEAMRAYAAVVGLEDADGNPITFAVDFK
jgi:hypothetical protein